jgi:hypothetical protein
MDKMAFCTWPDGQKRIVVVIRDDGERAKIIWNGKVDKTVVGFDEVVPSEWLNYVKHTGKECANCTAGDCTDCTKSGDEC